MRAGKLAAFIGGFAAALAAGVIAQDWYQASGVPVPRSALNSADLRTEFAAIQSDIADKLPVLDGNGGKIIRVNAGGTALEAASTGIVVSEGGTGATTLTGIVQGNGTSAFTALTSSTVGQTLRVTGANTFGWGALDLADADAITGDLPDANLSSNVPLKDAANTFTSEQTIVRPDGFRLMSLGDNSNGWLDFYGWSTDRAYIQAFNNARTEFGALQLDAGTLYLNGYSDLVLNTVSVSDFARKSQANIFTANQRIKTTQPVLWFEETDAGTNAGRWAMYSTSGSFTVQAVNDAESAGETAVVIGRTNGAEIASIALAADAITLNGVNATDFARLSQNASFSGTLGVSGAATLSGGLSVTGNATASGTVQGADLTATDDLSVADDATIAGSLTVNSLDLTPAFGTFSPDVAGFSTTPDPPTATTVKYLKVGNMVTIIMGTILGTSNSAVMAVTNVPNDIVPQTSQLVKIRDARDNGTTVPAYVRVHNDGDWDFATESGGVSGWTPSGDKGVSPGTTFTYITD